MSILNQYPTRKAGLIANFHKSKKIPTEAKYTRASIGSYVDSYGTLRPAYAGEPRFTHNPITKESLGLLIEESSTNSTAYSSSSLGWVDPSTMLDNAGLAPDGTYSAILCTNQAYYRGTPGYSPMTFSIFVKAGTSSTFNLTWAGYGGTDLLFNFNTLSFTAPSGSWTNLNVEPYPNGWYRLSATATNRTLYYYILYADSTTTSFYFWGLQIENKALVTSHIPTNPSFTSRASTASFYNSSGILQTASINVARSDAYFTDSTGVVRYAGLVLERASTNYRTNSESVGSWGSVGGQGFSVASNITTAPDGTTNADNIYGNSGNWTAVNLLESSQSVVNNNYIVMSIYAKYVPGSKYTHLSLNLNVSGSGSSRVVFNLSSGVITHIESINGYSERLPNGWYRLVAYSRNTSGSTQTWGGNTCRLFALTTSNGDQGGGTGTGTTTDGVYLWGGQVEISSSLYATSYIPTTTSAVTRSADVYTASTITRAADNLSIQTSKFLNPTGGTFYAESNCSFNNRPVFSLNNATAVNEVKALVYPTACGSRIIYNNIVTSGLVLWLDAGITSSYPGSGTTWTDLSGVGNNATLINGVGFNTSNGGCLTFDGTDDYGSINHISLLNPGISDFTFGSIFKVNSDVSTNFFPTVLNKSDGDWRNGYLIRPSWPYTGNFIVGVSEGQNNEIDRTTIISNLSSPLGSWVNIVGVWSSSSKTLKLYYNGVEDGSKTIQNNITINPTANLELGRFNRLTQSRYEYFPGNIAQIFLYNRALTTTEVQQNFNALRGRYGL